MIYSTSDIAISSENPIETDKTALDNLLNNYYQDNLKLFPLVATSLGDSRYNDSWPNYLTQEVIGDIKAYHTKYKEELSKINRDNLSEKDKLNYDVIEWECEVGLQGIKFKDYLMPVNQITSQQLFVPQMADGSGIQPFATVQDYNNWLKRLDQYLDWCDTAIVNMRKGMNEGYVLPKALTEKTIPQFEEFSLGPVEEHSFYKPVKNFPEDFNDADKTKLAQEYKIIIENRVIPTYKRMVDFLRNEYLPNCRSTAGISSTPLGKEYYEWCVKVNTTSNLTPDEIFEIGEREVARITKEMEALKKQVGFEGTLVEFFEYVKNKKELMPYSTPEQVLQNFESMYERIKPGLSKLFSRDPKVALEIKRMPEFLEASAQPYYIPGSPDGSRPGTFYVGVPDASKYNIFSDEVLFVHEGVPGHHYQVDWQMGDTSLPAIRQLVWYVGMGEGWALYAEALGKELGLYKDPYQYVGLLSFDMLRATRLVVDVGLHMKGWSREQAIQYLAERLPFSEDVLTSSVERYMGNPGQSLGYKVGQLKILALRDKAQKELGEKFQISEFHDQVLSAGCVPLQVLENKINTWIDSRKDQQ